MKKTLSRIGALSAFFVVSAIVAAWAQTYPGFTPLRPVPFTTFYVSPTGTDPANGVVNTCASASTPCRTAQFVLELAARVNNVQAKDLNQIAKMLYAMEQKRRKPDLKQQLDNERYQRTMSDEYPWVKQAKPRESIPAEVREQWKNLASR